MLAEENEAFDFGSFISNSREILDIEFQNENLRPNDLVILLNRASGIVTGQSEAQIHRPKGLSWNAFKVLFILWTMGDLEQHRVAMLAGTSRATTSAVVKTLVRNMHIVQLESATDKRTNVLALTDAGRDIVRTVYLEQNDLLGGWAGRLTNTEQDILKILLMKLMSGRD